LNKAEPYSTMPCESTAYITDSHSNAVQAHTRVGTVYYDEATGEAVMPPDFLGEKELRWKADQPFPERETAPQGETAADSSQAILDYSTLDGQGANVMATMFTPELGQGCFGNPWKEYEVPAFVRACLRDLADEVERVMSNCHELDDCCGIGPFGNSGAHFVTDVFEVHAYDWGAADTEEGQPFNFKWGDFELSWYKWFGRGMSMNREMGTAEAARMLDECLAATRTYEESHRADEAKPF
jgi:hypothetical protein